MSSSLKVFAGGVLRVTVNHVYHSVTEEVLHQVFEAYGVVQISVSERAGHVEAEVRFRTRNGAAQALALHGRCIYDRSCLLDIQDVSPVAPPAKSDMGELCNLFDKMSMSMFNPHMRSLLELKQTGTVVEYTAAFWECLHRVLDLDPNLNIKCFVQQYVEGLRNDIQAAVRSRSPSSITCASCLARIREEEIVEDRASGADKLGVSSGFTPSETLTDVFPELAAPVQCMASHDINTIDGSCRGAWTPTTCSTVHPSSDTTVDVFPKLAASAESDKDLNLDTVCVTALAPATFSTGGLAHGRDSNSPAAVSLALWTISPSSTGTLPCLQPKPPWVYSSQDLSIKGPRCWEHLYISGKLNLLASCWNLSSPELPLYGNDWYMGYTVTDFVVEKNWDPGVTLQSGSAPLAFPRRCCSLLDACLAEANHSMEQLGFCKFRSVCKGLYTSTHQWDPGILVGILHVPNLPCCQRVLVSDGLFNALSYGSSKCFFLEVQWLVPNCLCTSMQTDGNQCKCDWRRRCLPFAILVGIVKYLNEFVGKLRTNRKLMANNFVVQDLLSGVQDIHFLLKPWPYYCSFCLTAQIFVAMGRLASEGWH